MKIIIFGATGGIGRQVMAQALEAGHEVTSVARNPSAIALQHTYLNVVRGDVLDVHSLASIAANHHAVVSALGVSTREPTVLYSAGLANIVQVMKETDVRRILCVSASGLDPGAFPQSLIAKLILWKVLKHGFTDLLRMEKFIQAQSLDWTILRPPRLTDRARTGKYRIAVNRHLSNAWLLSRADLADYIVTHLEDETTYRATVEIAN